MSRFARIKAWRWCGESDDAAKAAAEKAAADKAEADRKTAEVGEKKFTQADVDRVISTRLARDKTEKEALIKQLEKFKESEGLSQQQKQELETQITTLSDSLRTKEEQAQFEKKTLETKFKTEIDTLSKDKDTWKSRFYDSTVKRAITDAALSAGGEIPEQFVMMFSGNTRLEEEKDAEGKLTGNFIPKIKFQGTDPETKKAVTLDLPVSEAFLKMRELGQHKNLFKHGANAGTGTTPSGGSGGSKDPSKMPHPDDFGGDQAAFGVAYQTWRQDYDADGKKRKKS